MSALPPKADLEWHSANVRFVPEADIAKLPELLPPKSDEHAA
jgi:hypothetical protein